jgi:hypothetical protein
MEVLGLIFVLAAGLLADSDNILPTLTLLALAILFYLIAWFKEEFTWEEVVVKIKRMIGGITVIWAKRENWFKRLLKRIKKFPRCGNTKGK